MKCLLLWWKFISYIASAYIYIYCTRMYHTSDKVWGRPTLARRWAHFWQCGDGNPTAFTLPPTTQFLSVCLNPPPPLIQVCEEDWDLLIILTRGQWPACHGKWKYGILLECAIPGLCLDTTAYLWLTPVIIWNPIHGFSFFTYKQSMTWSCLLSFSIGSALQFLGALSPERQQLLQLELVSSDHSAKLYRWFERFLQMLVWFLGYWSVTNTCFKTTIKLPYRSGLIWSLNWASNGNTVLVGDVWQAAISDYQLLQINIPHFVQLSWEGR